MARRTTTIQNSIEIDRPAEVVFDYCVEPANESPRVPPAAPYSSNEEIGSLSGIVVRPNPVPRRVMRPTCESVISGRARGSIRRRLGYTKDLESARAPRV